MRDFKFFNNEQEIDAVRRIGEILNEMDLRQVTLGDRIVLDTYNENNPEYYNTREFEFIGVTPILFEPITFSATRSMLFRNRETGETTQGQIIRENHPMWNYPNL